MSPSAQAHNVDNPPSPSTGSRGGIGSAAICASDGALSVWFQSAAGVFQAGGNYELAAGPTKLAAADLTGDGRPEVIVTSWVGGEVAVLTGGDGPTLYRFDSAGHPYGVATGDFDGDGRIDFAIANDGVEYITLYPSRSTEAGS